MDLLPNKIVWAKFGTSNTERTRQQTMKAKPVRVKKGWEHDDDESETTTTTTIDSWSSDVAFKPTKVSLEGWNVETIGFTETDLKSKYNHARFFMVVKEALQRCDDASKA